MYIQAANTQLITNQGAQHTGKRNNKEPSNTIKTKAKEEQDLIPPIGMDSNCTAVEPFGRVEFSSESVPFRSPSAVR